jgi:hypothetical protein
MTGQVHSVKAEDNIDKALQRMSNAIAIEFRFRARSNVAIIRPHFSSPTRPSEGISLVRKSVTSLVAHARRKSIHPGAREVFIRTASPSSRRNNGFTE